MEAAGYDPYNIGPDPERLARIGAFVELHVEQGRALDLTGDPVGIASAIWPHGRWRFDFRGEANHAGTTRLADRRDPMLTYAETVLAARREAELAGAVATFGKISVEPNGVNAIPSLVRGWLDSRAADQDTLDTVVTGIEKAARAYADRHGVDLDVVRESFTPVVEFGHALRDELGTILGREKKVPYSARARDTTRVFCPPPSPPPCCSYGTPRASRTPRRSSPPRTTAWPG
ncbi:Allantoate amidohydrolase [Streptomyces alboniger]